MPTASKPMDGAAAGSSAPSSARAITLYDTLGVAPSATTDELTTAYRRLALACHPDRPDGSKDKFQELQRAYEVLNNPANRTQYDALLKGKPVLKNFKRPAPLEKVEKPMYALLADLNFYAFEGAASKLRCNAHSGDGIEFNNDRGTFIGLAGDGFLYWTVNGRGYATQLCRADSDMALSNMHVAYRSNMGLRRKPLERSRAGNCPSTQQQQQRQGSRPSLGSAHGGGGSAHLAQTTGGIPRLTETERLRQQLRNKERHRSATKRLENIEGEETDERNELERSMWEKFCLLHTNLEAGMRCVTRGLPVATELALFMGYMSPEEVPLAALMTGGSLHSTLAPESPQAAALWVDPLECDVGNDDVDGEAPDDGSDVAAEECAHARQGTQGRVRSPSRSPSASSAAVSSSASPPSASDSAADTASDGDSCRARPTAGTAALNRTGYTAAYVSPQPSGSSPMVPHAVRPTVSASSSLGNVQRSPVQPAHLRSVSWASSPGVHTLPTIAAGGHGLAPEPRPAQAVHSTPRGGTTVQFASGPPPAAATSTSVSRDNDGLAQVLSSQEFARVSRASFPGADHPSLPNSLSSPPVYAMPGSFDEATPLDPNEAAAAARTAPFLQAAKDGAGSGDSGEAATSATRVAAGAVPASGPDDTATPTRPLFPWSIGHTTTRHSHTRSGHLDAGADSLARRSSASPSATAPHSLHPHSSSAGGPTVRGAAGGPSSASPSATQPTRERTSVFNAAHTHEPSAAATVTGADSQGRPQEPPRTTDGVHEAASPGPTRGEGEPRNFRLRASLSIPGDAPEADAAVSPRPQAPSVLPVAPTAHFTGASGGRSFNAQTYSRGESGDGRASFAAPSGGAADAVPGEEAEGPTQQACPQSIPSAPAATTDSAVEGSLLSPMAEREAHPITMPSGEFRFPAEASSARGRGDTVLTSGGVVSSSATTAGSTAPRVTVAPLRLGTSQDFGLLRSDQEAELDPPPLSPNAMAAEKRKRSKGRVTPRYMMATQAHARRASGVPSEGGGIVGQTSSPRLDTAHTYSSMTVEEMLAEEKDFMSSFAKTKRVT